MLYRVCVPVLPPQVAEAVVERWYPEVGDEVGFGDPVCDLLVKRNFKKVRPMGADSMKRSSTGTADQVSKRADIRVRVVSNDHAVLRTITAPPGTEVQESTALGVAATDPGEPLDGAPTMDMRLIAEMSAHDDIADAEWAD